MKRSHEERHDHREGVLNNSVRTVINTTPSISEKEKLDKGNYGQQISGNENSGYRASDLIKSNKPIHNRAIAPASIQSPHLPPMPALQTPLIPGFLSGAGHPLLNSTSLHQGPFVRGSSLQTAQYPFPTHIPILGAAAAAVAPPRPSTGAMRSSVPTLRPSSIPTQVSTNPISARPSGIKTSAISSPRTASPALTAATHPHIANHRINENRTQSNDNVHLQGLPTTPSSQISAVAAIQIKPQNDTTSLPQGQSIKSPQAHGLQNAKHTALKIGTVTTQTTTAISYQQQPFSISASVSTSATPVTAFKLPGVPSSFAVGVGQLYSQPPPIIIPSPVTTVSHSRVELQPSDIRPGPMHSSSIITSSIAMSSSATSVSHQGHHHGSADTRNDRGHHMSQAVTYPIGTYFVRDSVGFPHIQQINTPAFHPLLRPPMAGSVQSTSMSSLPLLAVESSRGISTPLSLGSLSTASKQVSSGSMTETRHSASDAPPTGLLTSVNTSAQSFNRYPNLQSSNYPSILPATISNSPRPSILRKRPLPIDTYGFIPNFFPVQTSEKVSSPTRNENTSGTHHIIPFSVISTSQNQNSLPTVGINETQQNQSSDSGSVGSDSTASASESSQLSASVSQTHDIKKEPESVVERQPLPASLQLPSRFSPSTEASPRKKPRKQLVITTEDKYGMIAPIEPHSSEDEDDDDDDGESYSKVSNDSFAYNSSFPSTILPRQNLLSKANQGTMNERSWNIESSRHLLPAEANRPIKTKSEALEQQTKEGESPKYVIRRPRFTIFGDYKVNSKAAYNHFYRYSDVRVKDERRHTCAEIAGKKSSRNSASCWKLFHVSSQLDDLSSLEEDVCRKMIEFQSCLPKPNMPQPQHQKSPLDEQLRLLHELIQGNIQRCRLSIEQLKEGKQTMMKVLDFKPKALELLKKHKQRKSTKKKQVSNN